MYGLQIDQGRLLYLDLQGSSRHYHISYLPEKNRFFRKICEEKTFDFTALADAAADPAGAGGSLNGPEAKYMIFKSLNKSDLL